MFQPRDLLATRADIQPLDRAKALLRSAVRGRLERVNWISRGSIELNDALRPDLTGELDADCFLIVPRNISAIQLCLDIKEIVYSTCSAQQWSLETRRSGYRLTIQVFPLLTLDLGILRNAGSRTERLDPGGYEIDQTDVLAPDVEYLRDLTNPLLHSAWLNLKYWAKSNLRWASRPSTHILRSIAIKHAELNGEDSIRAGWQGYVQWARSICDQLEGGELLRKLERSEQRSWATEKTIDSFVNSLRSYVDALKDMTSTEHLEGARGNSVGLPPLRVFVSSRQREFAMLRLSLATEAHKNIRFLLSEYFFPWHIRVVDGIDICEAEIDKADIFVGVYGNEYGACSPNRCGSPIDEELKRARDKLPLDNILLYSVAGSAADPKLANFLRRHSDIKVFPMFEDIDAAANQLISHLVTARSSGDSLLNSRCWPGRARPKTRVK